MTSARQPVVTASEVLYRSDVLTVRHDKVVMPDGARLARHVVVQRPACAAVVADELRGAVLLVRHYRHAVGRYLWDIPGGMIEPGESAVQAAAREVREETGVAIRDVREMLAFHPEPAFNDHGVTLVDAVQDSGQSESSPDEHEIGTMRWVPHVELVPMIRQGKIASSWSIIGLTLSSLIG